MDTTVEIIAKDEFRPQPKLSDWLWRPWYARAWWATIPVWWAGMVVSAKIAPLTALYESGFGALLNMLFHPMAPLLILGAAFARRWLDAFEPSSKGDGTSSDAELIIDDDWDGDWTPYGMPPPSLDIYNPRSGWLYVGTPGGPNNFS
jgi:hypothetical protein